MFDKHIYTMISALVGICCIIMQGPVVSIICLTVTIGMLIFAIKTAKESREGFEMVMLDILSIGLALLLSLVFSIYQIAITLEYQKNPNNLSNYGSSSSQGITVDDLARTVIFEYQLEKMSQTGNGDYTANGFKNFLQTEIEIPNVKVNGNTVTFNVNSNQVVFTVTKKDIKYKII